MVDSKRNLRVFLCHASDDKPKVETLYYRLAKDGFDAWLDKEKLIPGQDWQLEIPKAVRSSDVVVVCLSSRSVTKEGYVQKEIKIALDIADEKPDGTIYIIPIRLENCNVPDRLGRYHWVDLFLENGYKNLCKALQRRADDLGVIGILPENSTKLGDEESELIGSRITDITLLPTLTEHENWVWDMAFSPDSKLLASVSTDQTGKIVDVSSGKELTQLKGSYFNLGLLSITFHPNGRIVAIGDSHAMVTLFQSATGRAVKQLQLKLGQDPVHRVAFSSDGRKLVCSTLGGVIRLWEANTYKRIRQMSGHNRAAFNYDLSLMASQSDNGKIFLWDLSSGHKVRQMESVMEVVTSLAFSYHGNLLAGGNEDHTIQLWDMNTGIEIHRLKGHTGGIGSIMFRPGNQMLVSSSSDKTVRVWDTNNGQEVVCLKTKVDGHCLAFSHDGDALAIGEKGEGSHDRVRKIRLWRIN